MPTVDALALGGPAAGTRYAIEPEAGRLVALVPPDDDNAHDYITQRVVCKHNDQELETLWFLLSADIPQELYYIIKYLAELANGKA